MAFVYFIFGCFLATIIAVIITCVGRISIHKHKMKNYETIIEENLKSNVLKSLYLLLCERSFDYIKVYFIFQGIAKSMNGLALLFTVAGLVLTAATPFETNFLSYRDWGILISIISIICVVINIYINPTKRGSQYLERWRDVDKNLVKLIAILYTHDSKDPRDVKDLEEFAMKCAESLSNGEYKITSDEE